MKNKLVALLAALLLCLSLLPSQAIAAFDPVDNTPAAISEQEEPENSEAPDEPISPEHPVTQSSAPAQAEDPGLYGGEH